MHTMNCLPLYDELLKHTGILLQHTQVQYNISPAADAAYHPIEQGRLYTCSYTSIVQSIHHAYSKIEHLHLHETFFFLYPHVLTYIHTEHTGLVWLYIHYQPATGTVYYYDRRPPSQGLHFPLLHIHYLPYNTSMVFPFLFSFFSLGGRGKGGRGREGREMGWDTRYLGTYIPYHRQVGRYHTYNTSHYPILQYIPKNQTRAHDPAKYCSCTSTAVAKYPANSTYIPTYRYCRQYTQSC